MSAPSHRRRENLLEVDSPQFLGQTHTYFYFKITHRGGKKRKEMVHNHGVTFHEFISQLFPWFPVRTCACTQTSCICAVVTRGVSDELVMETMFGQIAALSLVTVSDVTSNQCWQLTAFI